MGISVLGSMIMMLFAYDDVIGLDLNAKYVVPSKLEVPLRRAAFQI